MNIALIFAGGVGSRMNSKAKPKQFLEIHGKPIIIQTIERFEQNSQIDAIALVCNQDWLDYMNFLIKKNGLRKVRWVVSGGNTALESQYNGLRVIEKDIQEDAIVLIHDGVRPLIDDVTISDCIESVRNFGSAVTTTVATETIIRVDEHNKIISTTNRNECRLARAPQCFWLKEIIAAHEQAIKDGKHDFIDSTTMMRYYGKELYVVEGPSENIKVTNPSDFYICRALLDAKENSQIFGL